MSQSFNHGRAAAIAAAVSTALGILCGGTAARAQPTPTLPSHVLYIEANLVAAGQNAVLAYRRGDDGSLTPLPGSPFLTGGTGWLDTTYSVGPDDADGIMAVDPIGGVLFVPNGGSKSVAALRMHADGSLTPVSGSPFAVQGNTPNSLGLRARTLVVVDNGDDPKQAGQGSAGYETMKLSSGDRLILNPAATVTRPTADELTQALPLDDTPFLFTNEFFGGTITTWFLDLRGLLHLVERQAPPQEGVEASQPLPLGLAVNPVAPYVYVGLPNVNRIAAYRWGNDGHLTFVRSAPVSGVAPCWIHASKDGRFLYVVNTIAGSVSVMSVARPDAPREIQRLDLRGVVGGSYQIAAAPDERLLYTMEEEDSLATVGLSNQVHVLARDPVQGTLREVPSSPVKLPVPGGNRPQGFEVF